MYNVVWVAIGVIQVIIDKSLWHICKICQKDIKELSKVYGGCGIYFTQVFESHLQREHNIDLNDYFFNYCNLDKILCPCSICHRQLPIIKKSSNFKYKELACGRNSGVLLWSERAKETRKGAGNPMYGATAWNKNLPRNHPFIQQLIQKQTGKKYTDAQKQKMSLSAKRRIIHGHTGCKHTDESKERNRQKTLQRIKNGDFQQTKTRPHLAMKVLLDKLNIEYIEEFVLHSWSFDFFLTTLDILLEVDGDYFHSNPKIYPNGPRTNTQKINHYRDYKKNQFCQQNNLSLMRFWESDILNNIEGIECQLKELFL